MTEQEFSSRTGLNVGTDISFDEFNAIHIMYLESGQDMDKDRFCKDWMEHRNSELLAIFYRQADKLKDKMETARREMDKMCDFLVDAANDCSSLMIRQKAIDTLGLEEYLNRKIQKGYALWDIDKEQLCELLKGHGKKFFNA